MFFSIKKSDTNPEFLFSLAHYSFFGILLLIFSAVIVPEAVSQSRISVESATVISSENRTPFWLQSNRHGIYSRHGSQFLARFLAEGRSDLSEDFSLYYGADLIGRPGEYSALFFNQGYLKVSGLGLEMAAGRFYHTSPIHHEKLSSGSLGISTNASPIPKIRFGLAGWTPVPFTREFVEIKGHMAHGWLGSRRYIDNVLLHEKVFHVRFGGKASFKPYAGLAHYVKWGGTEPSGRSIPTRFRDFLGVFFAFAGEEGTPGPDQTYVLGDHLGAIDLGFFLEWKGFDILVYRQFPFELKTNLLLKSYMDALTGISVTLPESFPLPVDQFLYEYLYTKYQAGPREPRNLDVQDDRGEYRYNENYYNHYFYRSGWVYHLRTIGNPLFTPNEENLGILNNRIVAHHIGFISKIEDVEITAKATFSRNFGKRCDNRIPDIGENELFGIECINDVETVGGRSLDQWSLLLGLETPLSFFNARNLNLFIHLALDNGKVAGDQFGSLFGLRWSP